MNDLLQNITSNGKKKKKEAPPAASLGLNDQVQEEEVWLEETQRKNEKCGKVGSSQRKNMFPS